MMTDRGQIALKIAEKVVGRAGRLAYLVPDCRPFVLSLFAALAAAKAHANATDDQRTDHKILLPTSRFAAAARWLYALIRPSPTQIDEFPLEHLLVDGAPKISLRDATLVTFDASLWGAGAVRYIDGHAADWFEVPWTAAMLQPLGLAIGDPRCQQAFEYLALLLVLLAWGAHSRGTGLAILGDNIAALQNALTLRGKGPLNAISREIG